MHSLRVIPTSVKLCDHQRFYMKSFLLPEKKPGAHWGSLLCCPAVPVPSSRSYDPSVSTAVLSENSWSWQALGRVLLSSLGVGLRELQVWCGGSGLHPFGLLSDSPSWGLV